VLSWLAKQLLDRNLARLNAGDYKPLLRMDHDDVRFRFPGDSSWATELQGKDELARWLQRFVDTGLQIFADEVAVAGPPWNMKLCIRGHDYLRTPEGETIYANRYVIWGHMAWGKLRDYEVYEDTQASKALDAHLEADGQARNSSSVSAVSSVPR
jgi:ketosteroid isomerase-like protein